MKGTENKRLRTKTLLFSSSGFRCMARMRKKTRLFKPFSLNAPWNCVAIKLQKPRRQFFSCSGMDGFSFEHGDGIQLSRISYRESGSSASFGISVNK
jgi:hypothetical protein